MIRTIYFLAIIFLVACNHKIVAERTTYFPKRIETMSSSIKKENVWVFIMAGQSNMAGRGAVASDAEFDQIAAYLAKSFPKHPLSAPPVHP